MFLQETRYFILQTAILAALVSLVWFNHLALSETSESLAFRLQILSGNLQAWSFTCAYEIIKPVFQALGKNLSLLNTVYFLFLMICAGYVGFTYKNEKRLCEKRALQNGFLISMASCGIILYAPHFVVEYNHLALISTLSIALLVPLVLQSDLKTISWKVVSLGVMLGFLTSVKVSAGLLLSLAVWTLFLIGGKSQCYIGIIFQFLAWWFLGAGTGVGLFSGDKVAGLGHFPEYDLAMTGILSHLGFKKIEPAILYLLRLLLLNLVEIFVLLITGLAFFFSGKSKKLNPHKNKAYVCIVFWVIFSVIFFLAGGDSAQTPEKHNYHEYKFWLGKMAWYGAFTALPAFFLVAMNLSPIIKIRDKTEFYFRILLLVAPFVCSFGTAFRLIHHSVIYSWMWGLVYLEGPKTQISKRGSVSFLISTIVFCQAFGASLQTFVVNHQNRSYARSLKQLPNGKYFRCSVETEQWLLKIKTAAEKYSIPSGGSVSCHGEYLASFLMNWKNPSPNENAGKHRWLIVSVPPLRDRQPTRSALASRSLAFALFGPPGDASISPLISGNLHARGYKKMFRTLRPDGNFTEFWEKPTAGVSL